MPGSSTSIHPDPHTPHQDAPTLRLWDGWVAKIEDSFNALAGLSILFLILLAVVQVVGRAVFNTPVPGFIDFVEQSMALFAFLGIAYTQRLGGHIRMELILSGLSGRVLWFAEAFATLLVLVLIAALINGSFDHFLRSWNLGDSTIDIRLPTWPSKLVVPIALSLLWLRLIIQFAGYARLLLAPDKAPVAVPLIESIKEHAQHEIEDALGDETGDISNKSQSRENVQ
ncbi:TRAP transporter small permease subunit [Cohaesibacter gelatinilyticus]|uniref:TRAP transporter small permease protein n=1 Tax=Cohaesibacter gelatinilyticus TaxID=372072 RepID=A0A285PEC1_9HYPH|nr:TRAP transporter small permease [Cohaesibacter gelatinilyticus]SNZ19778.1 TRAP-type mannitol/chloroaromatic compound transport system, small permease component [Cohaesibacter gelatinilyticus]